jgi:ribonuclease P protein component
MAPDTGLIPPTGAFRKEDRVRKRPEYKSIYRRCTPMFTACLVFYPFPGEGGRRRFGCTVPKVVGGAVVRNRVKRILRDCFRRQREAFPEGCVLVVNAKRSAATMTHGEAARSFKSVAERLAREGFSPCAP